MTSAARSSTAVGRFEAELVVANSGCVLQPSERSSRHEFCVLRHDSFLPAGNRAAMEIVRAVAFAGDKGIERRPAGSAFLEADRRDALAPASELGVLHCRFQNADLLYLDRHRIRRPWLVRGVCSITLYISTFGRFLGASRNRAGCWRRYNTLFTKSVLCREWQQCAFVVHCLNTATSGR